MNAKSVRINCYIRQDIDSQGGPNKEQDVVMLKYNKHFI